MALGNKSTLFFKYNINKEIVDEFDMEKTEIAVFASGNLARKYINECHEYTIIAVFDNDPNKWGELFCGYEILNPKYIPTVKFSYLVIATVYENDIREQLVNLYPELLPKMCSIEKINALEYVYRQYKHRYGEEVKCENYVLSDKRIVIYTAIFGKYDILRNPLYVDQKIDYICYTNDKYLTSEIWDIRYIDCEQDNMPLEVRKYKCMPHRFLSEYDISVWIDARMQIKNSILEYIKENMRNTGMLFFPHSERDCVYQEGAACITQHKEDVTKLIQQMYKYSYQGYPEHNGLYCGGCIVREHNRSEIIKIMEDWYEEILCTSVRDQISLPYILSKHNFSPDLCKEYIWDNDLLNLYDHKV